MTELKREDFFNTNWDVSDWTEDQKILWQEKCFSLGFGWVCGNEEPRFLEAKSYQLWRDLDITYSDNNYKVDEFISCTYEDMFPEAALKPLNVVDEIRKLFSEEMDKLYSVEEDEDERGFEGLVYVSPEHNYAEDQYFCLDFKNLTEDQKAYTISVLAPEDIGEYGIQICNDGCGWFKNTVGIEKDDIQVSFNDLFQYKDEL